MVGKCMGCSVALSCLTLCDPMDCSTPGFPVLHHLPELAQTHVHWVGDAIQPSCPGSSKWMSSSHQVAKLLDLQCQHQSFQWIFRIDFLLVWSPCSPEDCQESSPTPQFKSINSSVLSFLYSATLTSIHEYWKNHRFDYQVDVKILNGDLPENYQRNTET